MICSPPSSWGSWNYRNKTYSLSSSMPLSINIWNLGIGCNGPGGDAMTIEIVPVMATSKQSLVILVHKVILTH